VTPGTNFIFMLGTNNRLGTELQPLAKLQHPFLGSTELFFVYVNLTLSITL